MTDERRHDEDTRKRYDELELSLREWRQNVDERLKRVVKAVFVIAMAALASSVIGYGLLQGQRYSSIISSCQSRNQISMGVIKLLNDFHTPQPGLARAKRRFPVIKSCRGYADTQVSWFRL